MRLTEAIHPHPKTISEIARDLGAERHRVVWVVTQRRLEPALVSGRTRAFGPEAVAAIKAEIHRIDSSKRGGVAS